MEGMSRKAGVLGWSGQNGSFGLGWDNDAEGVGVRETVHIPDPVAEGAFVIMPEWVQATLMAGNILVLIFAFCGNLAAITIVAKSKLSRLTTKLFLITLALSDLVLVLASAPVDLGAITSKYHSWVFGELICEVVSFFQIQAVMMNAFCLFAIALDRYLSVIRSLKTPLICAGWESRLPYIGLFCIWIVPAGTSVPQFWAYEQFSFWTSSDLNATTGEDESWNTLYYLCSRRESFDYNTVFYATLGFVFFSLLVGFLFCYLSIIHFVQTHRSKFGRGLGEGRSDGPSDDSVLSSGRSPEGSRRYRHRRTVRLIMGLMSIFLVCRTPAWVFVILVNSVEVQSTQLTLSLMYFLHLLSNLNTALSPFLYAVWNDALRLPGKKGGTGKGRKGSSCFGSRDGGLAGPNNEPIGVFFIKRGKGNKYNFTSQSRVFPSSSTQKYFISERNEFPRKSTTTNININ